MESTTLAWSCITLGGLWGALQVQSLCCGEVQTLKTGVRLTIRSQRLSLILGHYSSAFENVWLVSAPDWGIPTCCFSCSWSMALTAWLLKPRPWEIGVFQIQSYKILRAQIYHDTWKAYFSWCESRKFHLIKYSIFFLQLGLDKSLALSYFKCQISALAVLFQRSLTSYSLMRVAHIVPVVHTRVTLWDLNLVL